MHHQSLHYQRIHPYQELPPYQGCQRYRLHRHLHHLRRHRHRCRSEMLGYLDHNEYQTHQGHQNRQLNHQEWYHLGRQHRLA